MQLIKSTWFYLIILAGISAIAYLPLVSRFGYYNDDWYLMYDAHTQGAQFIHEIFHDDRPGRAFLMIPMFSLFGLNPLYYNVSAYFFRVLGGASLYWILRMLWPRKYFTPGMAAILFTIYPGFLSQTNAIDYQSHILALFLALLSIALTIKSITVASDTLRFFMIALSIMIGWMYLSQMEYFIGVEAFRFACVSTLLWRDQVGLFWRKTGNILFRYLPFLAIPGGFLLWRLLFFSVERRATDIGFQLGQLFNSQLTGLWWLAYLFQDILNVLFVAWALPLSALAFQLRLREVFIGIGLSALAVLLVMLAGWWIKEKESREERGSADAGRGFEELWVGWLGLLGGLLPVILANRHIVFPDFSRYTLVASAGAVILIALIITKLATRTLQVGLTGFLVALAVLTHHGNSVRAAAITETMQGFWWQVSWRAPNIKPGTTLIAHYPVGSIQEDYFVWGPANLIYYPEKQDEVPIEIKLPAVVLTDEAVLQILVSRGVETSLRRGNELTRNFTNVLIMTQAEQNSCVRLLDGNNPNLSIHEPQRIILISSKSNLDNVLTDEHVYMPPSVVFGKEPPQNWCYYYQKADLARQKGDWQEVARLGDEAQELGLHPNDQIELMPFLQAYAFLGNKKEVKGLSTRINTQLFYRQQACQQLSSMANSEHALSAEMQRYAGELFCK